jgi:hypothetical protein
LVEWDNVVYKTLKSDKQKGFDFTGPGLAEGAGKEKLEAIQSILKVFARTRIRILRMKYIAASWICYRKPMKISTFHSQMRRIISDFKAEI